MTYRKKSRKKRYAVALLGTGSLALAYGLYWASLGAITVAVENVGTQPLTSVVIVTEGKRYPLGDVEPGRLRQLRFDPVQDTGLTVSSGAGETKVDTY